jgi:hypothetical protein
LAEPPSALSTLPKAELVRLEQLVSKLTAPSR